MRLVRVLYDGDCRYGLADDDTITLISDEPFASWEPEGLLPVAEANFLAPVPPTKVVCVGLNYRPHIAEMGHDMPEEPVLFLKPSTAVIGPGQTIPIPAGHRSSGLRGGARRGHRTADAQRDRQGSRRERSRPVLRKRRDRARPSEALTASGRGRRGSTASARSVLGWPPKSTRTTSRCSAS